MAKIDSDGDHELVEQDVELSVQTILCHSTAASILVAVKTLW